MKKVLLTAIVVALVGALALPLLATPQTAEASLFSKPVIACDADTLTFDANEDGIDPAIQILGIRNDADGRLWWWVSDNAGWLKLSPPFGISKGEVDDVMVTVDIDGLSAGTYTAEIKVSALRSENGPVRVTVTLNVGAAGEGEGLRVLGPALAGPYLGLEEADYKGVTSYLGNGPDVYHCPILDLVEISVVGTWWLSSLSFGAEEGVLTPVTGGNIFHNRGAELKQLWPVEHPGEGEVVGGVLGKMSDMGSCLPDVGDNSLLVLDIDTGAATDINGDRAGDFTYLGVLITDLSDFIYGMASHLEDIFPPSEYPDLYEGSVTRWDLLQGAVTVSRWLGGIPMEIGDGSFTMTDLDEVMAVVIKLMPAITSLVPYLMPMLDYVLSSALAEYMDDALPPLLILQPMGTGCPMLKLVYGPDWGY